MLCTKCGGCRGGHAAKCEQGGVSSQEGFWGFLFYFAVVQKKLRDTTINVKERLRSSRARETSLDRSPHQSREPLPQLLD